MLIAFRDVLRKTARSLGIEPAMHLGDVESRWSGMVGPTLAGATSPRSLRNGILTVTADHPLAAQEMRLRSQEIVAVLQREIPRAGLRRLRVVVRGRASEANRQLVRRAVARGSLDEGAFKGCKALIVTTRGIYPSPISPRGLIRRLGAFRAGQKG